MNGEENLHAGHRDRTVKKFLNNPDAFSDHELLEILLFYAIPRKDTNALAHRIIKMFGNLSGVLNASPKQLTAVDGVGEKVATEIAVVGKIFKRIARTKKEKRYYNTFECVREQLTEIFSGQREEKFVMLLLGKKYELLSEISFSDNEKSSVSADVSEFASVFGIHRPSYAVIAHNHTSSCSEPSKEDDFTTHKINLLCDIHGVGLLDHVIFSSDGKVFSYAMENRLDKIKANSNFDKFFNEIKEN